VGNHYDLDVLRTSDREFRQSLRGDRGPRPARVRPVATSADYLCHSTRLTWERVEAQLHLADLDIVMR
jgi:hypothetical protein